MKTSTKILAVVATTAALALATAVSAQPGYGPGSGMGPGWGGMGPGWGHMGSWGGMGPGWGHMGGWGGMGPGFGMMGFAGYDMADAAAARLAGFKSQLKITPAQESAWKAYESAITEQARSMQALRDQFHAKWQSAKPGEVPDMTAQHQAMFALRQSGWDAQNKALKDLYAVLTPEQQALVGGGWVGPRGTPRR